MRATLVSYPIVQKMCIVNQILILFFSKVREREKARQDLPIKPINPKVDYFLVEQYLLYLCNRRSWEHSNIDGNESGSEPMIGVFFNHNQVVIKN